MYYIYEVTTIDNLRYIGITKNLNGRLWEHTNRPHHGRKLKEYRILDKGKDKSDALDIEWYWINILEPELNTKKIGSPPPERVFSLDYLKKEYDRVMNIP